MLGMYKNLCIFVYIRNLHYEAHAHTHTHIDLLLSVALFMYIIQKQAITQDKQDLRNMYQCPVYKTRTRGPTYVWTFNLKSKDKPSKWTLAGVALLLQV